MFVFLQAEDGIRFLVRSRGFGIVYKRQAGWREGMPLGDALMLAVAALAADPAGGEPRPLAPEQLEGACLLYTSDAADERSSVDLGGRRILKKKTSKGRSLWQRSH